MTEGVRGVGNVIFQRWQHLSLYCRPIFYMYYFHHVQEICKVSLSLLSHREENPSFSGLEGLDLDLFEDCFFNY